MLVQKQGGIGRYMPALEEPAIEYIRNRIRAGLAAMQSNPGNHVFGRICITDMNAVYNAHAAKQVVNIFDGGAAGQISNLYKHILYQLNYFYAAKTGNLTEILHKSDNTPVA